MKPDEEEFRMALEVWNTLAKDFMERERIGMPTEALRRPLAAAQRKVEYLMEKHGIKLGPPTPDKDGAGG